MGSWLHKINDLYFVTAEMVMSIIIDIFPQGIAMVPKRK